MKKSIQLKSIITCLVTFLVSVLLSVTFYVFPAKAAGGSLFEVEYGASVKLTENGLRFKAKMDEAWKDYIVQNDDAELWAYIAPVEEFDKVENYNYSQLGVKVGGKLDESKIYQEDDGYYYANAVITGLDAYQLQTRSFSAIFFVKDGNGITYAEMAKEGGEGAYATVSDINNQNRTQYYVLNAAMLDGEESYETRLMSAYGDWYGTEEYPIIVNNAAQYNALMEKANNQEFANKLATKTVFVKQGAGDASALASKATVMDADHIVTFYDGNKIVKLDFVKDGNSANAPEITREGYEFVKWVGNYASVSENVNVYANWKFAKTAEKNLGDMTVYGITRADGVAISSSSDVIDERVILASGDLGNGAYYPGETNSQPDPTDENNTADQAFIAYDGEYSFNDYFVADFTGKNMPTLAFFAKDYDNSIFYGNGTKTGVVVSTGLTWPDGRLFAEDTAYCTSVFNGKGLCMWGPHMIYSTAKNYEGKGVLLHSNVTDIALGRANLVDGKQYKIIMGMQEGSNTGDIKIVYALYDLDTNTIVETAEYVTYNFFTGSNAAVNSIARSDLKGSIVAYGYFGTPTVLDKTYGIYEDTSVNAIAETFGLPKATAYNASYGNDKVVLNAGVIGGGANYTKGQNNGGSIDQAYLGLDGNYGLNDYIAFDFTGKNMPEIAFFANNYNNSMYAEGTSKEGIVVVTGITTWDGQLSSGVNGNGTQINYGFPYMIQDASSGAFCSGALKSSALGRANLADGTQYRVIMGFTGSGNAITLHWYLYNLDTDAVVEESSMTTWNFFTGSNAQVGNKKITDLAGSIVLYGKFGTTCEIDKLHGVFEDSSILEVSGELGMNPKTVIFKNYDGSILSEEEVPAGLTPTYTGAPPVRPADVLCDSYAFNGWDKEITAVTENITYTATFTGELKENGVTVSTSKPVTYDGKLVLGAGNIGGGANYTIGQNNGGTVDQAYLALDGDYGLGDFIMFDFTGKNMPEVAFFANNYNNSMYAEGTSKEGIVVVTGITTWDGQLSSGVNGNGTQINYGFPYMIQDASSGAFCSGALKSSALGRANLADGTQYRVIMGFTGSGNAITLHWYLYNLDTDAVVEESSMTTWNFFTGSNAQVGNKKITDLAGSIVLYGKFGTTCEIDKLHGVFEDTTLSAITSGFGQTATVTFQDEDGTTLEEYSADFGSIPVYSGATPEKAENALYTYAFAGWDKGLSLVTGDVTYTATYTPIAKANVSAYNTTVNGNAGVVLGNGNIGNGANYTIGQNAGGSIDQAYYAIDGNYGLNDYLVLDFTGKNMPEVMFFAKNYDGSMYYSEGKQGVVVASGITLWDGSIGSAQTNNTMVGVSGPFGAYYQSAAAPYGGNMLSDFAAKLARENLVDGTQYRIIMGFTGGSSAFNLEYKLYNLTTGELVEEVCTPSWAFFTGNNAAVNNMTLEDLVGSIVLYGKFKTTCTVDRIWDVYEDTDIATIIENMFGNSESGGETADETLGYSKYTDTFDFYAYSSYSDGTYEIDGETYYIGKNLANLKQYAQYGNAGMTIYFPQNDCLIDGTESSIAKAKRLIDDLAKVGIHKTILQDNRILHLSLKESAIVGSGLQFADEAALDAYIYECVKDYADYPGVYGIQLGDEPKYVCLEAYAAVYKSIKRVNQTYGFNLHIQYNLNPLNFTQVVYEQYYPATSGTYDWNNYRYIINDSKRYTACVARYTQYINDFLDAMQPDSIMYDDYPLMENKSGTLVMSDTYIPCLQIVAKAAADRNIKFYNVTQAFENNADGSTHRRQVTEAGAKWLNNILIGFGAKQIAYYTYYTRGESDSTGGESYVDGSSFVDYNGNPTDLYYTMQNVMSNNQTFASTVLQFDYKGSRYYSGSSVSSDKSQVSRSLTSSSFSKLSAFSVDKELALVTELYDDENNNYMYMAMNISNPDVGLYTQNVSLTFNGYTHVRVYRDGEFTNVALTNGVYSASLNAGEAVYVIPYNN